jgi:hypothetical protein
MSSSFIDTERRRSKRYEIKLGAILAFEEPVYFAQEKLLSLNCYILDFSAHGLFLEIKKSFMDMSLLLHKKVKVLIQGSREKTGEVILIEAEVMRIGSDGIGVAFEKVPESFLSDLPQKAKIKFETTSSEAIFSENSERIKASLKKVLEENLPVLMEAFFKRVRSDLEQAAAKTVHFSEEAAFLDAIRDLGACRAAIGEKFSGYVISELDLFSKAGSYSQTMPAEHKLVLADKDDFEDWLSFSASIKRVAANLKAPLSRLERKLSYITGIALNDMSNPVSPNNLFRSFDKSIGEIEGIGTIKPTLYKSFENALIRCLPELYQAVEGHLGECGGSERIVEEEARFSNKPFSSAE